MMKDYLQQFKIDFYQNFANIVKRIDFKVLL